MSGDERSEAPEHAGNWYVLVFGLPLPAETVTLAPGVSLRPLPGPLTVFDLAAAGAAGFDSWAVVSQVASRCTCEIESARDSDTTPGYDTLSRAWLAISLLVLRGFGSALPIASCAYPWAAVAIKSKQEADWFQEFAKKRGLDTTIYGKDGSLPRFRGRLLEFHTRLMISRGSRKDSISEEDARWCREHFDRFNQLCASSDRFRFALEAAIDWRYGKDERAAISRLWAGIESLFAVSAELVFRLSVYIASVLHERGPERTLAYRKAKKLYGVRSKAVHGDEVSLDSLREGMSDSFELLRMLLLKCIERGREFSETDLEKVVFE